MSTSTTTTTKGLLPFCEELKQAAGSQWDRVVNHKFTHELAAGTIDQEVLKRYLIQDHRFLDAFVCLLASIVAKARCLQDRIAGCQFLALITGTENTYFERSFQALGIGNETERMTIPDATCTTKFCNLMRDVVANGSLGEMLAVIVVCEWSYLSWGERVLQQTVRNGGENFDETTAFCTYEWVDLHSGEYFTSVVEYLCGLLNKEGELSNEEERQACRKRFLEAVQCEEDFFDYAYEG